MRLGALGVVPSGAKLRYILWEIDLNEKVRMNPPCAVLPGAQLLFLDLSACHRACAWVAEVVLKLCGTDPNGITASFAPNQIGN
jgi:hypothetical protein